MDERLQSGNAKHEFDAEGCLGFSNALLKKNNCQQQQYCKKLSFSLLITYFIPEFS